MTLSRNTTDLTLGVVSMLHPWLLLLVHEEYVSQSILFFCQKASMAFFSCKRKISIALCQTEICEWRGLLKTGPNFCIFFLHLVVVFNTYLEVMMQYNTRISYSNLWRTLWTGYLGWKNMHLFNGMKQPTLASRKNFTNQNFLLHFSKKMWTVSK